MNVIGLVFAGIIMFAFIFFGLGASQSLIDGTNITASDEMYNEFETSKEIREQTFNFMGYLPYLLFITALLGTLLMLTKLRM